MLSGLRQMLEFFRREITSKKEKKIILARNQTG
jgi:hypothetical protein